MDKRVMSINILALIINKMKNQSDRNLKCEGNAT